MSRKNIDQAPPEATALIEMVRCEKEYPAPWSADVHPAEVDNYRLGGWEIKK